GRPRSRRRWWSSTMSRWSHPVPSRHPRACIASLPRPLRPRSSPTPASPVREVLIEGGRTLRCTRPDLSRGAFVRARAIRPLASCLGIAVPAAAQSPPPPQPPAPSPGSPAAPKPGAGDKPDKPATIEGRLKALEADLEDVKDENADLKSELADLKAR